jgi:uncharacterized protein (DUF1501 family)
MRKTQPNRRELLRVGATGLAAISLSGTIPAFLSQFAYAQTIASTNVSNDNILVVIQMSGGNDGLNTVVPAHDDAYRKARPTLGLKDRLFELDDKLSLNAGMGEFKKLFDAGRLAVINGCGYPHPNRSHFESMAIWQSADPAREARQSGWLAHYLEHALRGTDNPMKGVNIGSELPLALVGDGAPVPSIQSMDDYAVKTDQSLPGDAELRKRIIRDLNAAAQGTPALRFLSRQALDAIVSADEVRKLGSKYHADADYAYGFAKQLQLIAQLITGGLGTRVFYCQVGGFDTHANQVYGHEQVLASVATAIAAFHKDLDAKGLGGKVTVMCFSEFGRRVKENASRGTDHGTAGPMFVSGGGVKGGLYGAYPSLADLDDGDLKFTTDFRRVYATVLERCLNADSTAVLGEKFEPVAFM